jgi:GT2 family glycosyltransferase
MRRCVVIPHRSRADLLARALAAVEGEDVFVVDDTDEGLAPVSGRGGPRATVVRAGGGVGFGRAVNLGLDAAQDAGFTHALVLNDDAEPAPGCLDALAAACAPDVGAVGPVVLGSDGVESAGFLLSRWGRVVARRTVPRGADPVPVDALSGACLLLDTRARFDVDYRHGMEDLALCRALRAAGRRVLLVPTASCRHAGGATISRTSRAAQRHAVAGHLRLVGGGLRSPIVLGLAVAQVLRERGPADRLLGVAEGLRDFRWPRGTPRG